MANIKQPVTPNIHRPRMGFNDYAERLNGRAAMVAFIAIILIELITGKGILSWLGWI
ncbi:MAG: chlorophyll a/b-binding protein [Nodosilinea sp. LVE1205-7]|jgi:hypothetical protein